MIDCGGKVVKKKVVLFCIRCEFFHDKCKDIFYFSFVKMF